MKVSYYPGCSLHGTAKEYDLSTRLVSNHLGIELEELPDWSCCGASSGHSVNENISLLLPCRNIAIADKFGLDLVTPCAACFNRLKTGEAALREDSEKRKEIEDILDFKFKGRFKIYHLLDYILNVVTIEKVKEKAVNPLKELKVACYYGCLIVRPNKVTQCDLAESPEELDGLMSGIGCSVREWSYKNECCGAGLSLIKGEIVENLVDRLITTAKRTGADAIVTACPLCQANLEMRQTKEFPIFYFTELLGVAFGLKEINECLDMHIFGRRPGLLPIGK